MPENKRIILNISMPKSVLHALIFAPFIIAVFVCFVVNLAVSHRLDWFFIILTSLVFAYSLFYAPILIKRHRAPLSIGVNAALLFVMLLVIDIYAYARENVAFGWSFKIGLPILLFWLCAVYSIWALVKFAKINWAYKTAIIIGICAVAQAIFNFVLMGLNIGTDGKFWNANLSIWHDEFIAPNVLVIINLSLLGLASAFAIFGTWLKWFSQPHK
jgi:hypothetical protein